MPEIEWGIVIIDTFPFNKDFRTLEIRLTEMGELVDLIVISEANLTHSGRRKPFYLSDNIGVLGQFRHKVKVLNVAIPKKVKNPRIRELIQRTEITKYLSNMKLKQNDYIIHSDCDEIPRNSLVKEITEKGLRGSFVLELDNYANALNLSDGKWKRLRIVSGDCFKSIQQMRQDIFLQQIFKSRSRNYALVRIPDFWTSRKYLFHLPQLVRRPVFHEFKNAGWHFNNLITMDEVIGKIEDSSHTEWATEDVRKLAVQNFLNDSCIYTGRPFLRVTIDETFPAEIQKNPEKWAMFIRR